MTERRLKGLLTLNVLVGVAVTGWCSYAGVSLPHAITLGAYTGAFLNLLVSAWILGGD